MYEQESIQICLCCKTVVFFFFHFCSSFLRIERSFFFSCFGGLYFTVNIVWLTEIQCAPRLLLSIHFLSGNLYCHSYTTFVYNVCINGAHVSWESVFFLALVFFPFVERIKSRWNHDEQHPKQKMTGKRFEEKWKFEIFIPVLNACGQTAGISFFLKSDFIESFWTFHSKNTFWKWQSIFIARDLSLWLCDGIWTYRIHATKNIYPKERKRKTVRMYH